MSELEERINEAIEEGGRSKLTTQAGALVAVSATFLAIGNVKAGNVVQAMGKTQVEIVDTWAFFQAKSTKQSLVEASIDQVTLERDLQPVEQRARFDGLLEGYRAKVERYEKEKGELQAKVESLQKEYDALNVKDDQFDISEALLSIGIALFGITVLTQKRWMLFLALGLAGFGMAVGLAGFLGWNLRPEWLARIIGA
jgi:hypothetical protein